MVKAIYALTLFAGLSVAAPVPLLPSRVGDLAGHLLPSGLKNLRRDGHGNLVAAGADSSVGQLLTTLTGREAHQHEELQLSGLLGNLPLLSSLTGGNKPPPKSAPAQKGGKGKKAPMGNGHPMAEPHNVPEPESHRLNGLAQLTGKQGLGSLLSGNSHHGVGLLPQRRDANEQEAHAAPIEGATLTDVHFNGGMLGRLAGIIPGGKK